MDKKELQYTYTEKDMYYFMDTQSFEEVSIEMKVVGDKADFFKEGMALEVRGVWCPSVVVDGLVCSGTLPPYPLLWGLIMSDRIGLGRVGSDVGGTHAG